MLNISLHKVNYKIAESWVDLTLEQFVRLSVLCKEKLPDALHELYEAITDEEEHDKVLAKISEQDGMINFNLFYKEVLIELSNIPADIINDKMVFEDVISIYKTYLLKFVLGMYYMPQQDLIPELSKFKFDGTTWWLPIRHMAKASFGQYIEAAQVEMNAAKIAKGDISYISQQIAILARKRGEAKKIFDEELIMKRAKLFDKLNMVTVWGVAFFLLKPISLSEGVGGISILSAQVRKVLHDQQQPQASDGISASKD